MPLDWSQLQALISPQPGMAYAGGTPNFDESTGRYTTPQQITPASKQYPGPVGQPAFTPISRVLQGQQPPTQGMPGPPQGWPTEPRTMPPMAQGQMPNLAQMLAQLGGKFPLMDPSTFMRNTTTRPTDPRTVPERSIAPPNPPLREEPQPPVTPTSSPTPTYRWGRTVPFGTPPVNPYEQFG